MIQRPAITVHGRAIRASNDNPAALGAAWQAFFGAGGPAHIPGRTSDDILAIYTDYEGDHTQPYTFVLGCEVPADAPLPAGLSAHTIPAGTYVRVDAHGPQPDTLIATWPVIWETVPNRAFQADVEVHPAKDPSRVSIWIGVA